MDAIDPVTLVVVQFTPGAVIEREDPAARDSMRV